jgi:membrane associated rhomboid family serine protease
MFGGRFSIMGGTPPVVKNLIYLNVIMFLASLAFKHIYQIDLTEFLGVHYFQSPLFQKYQLITYMFMHSLTDPTHIFFNMFGLWMFGRVLEGVWGSQRFFIYYFVTGIGAILINMAVQYIEYSHLQNVIVEFSKNPSPDSFEIIMNKYFSNFTVNPNAIVNWSKDISNPDYINAAINALNENYMYLINIPTVGASGAIFGILLAFGMLFPNTELMLLFPPIPIKAKWFVLGYGAIELFMGLTQPGSNIAHFAHLGGMLFGFILIKYWNNKRTNFY